MTANIKELAKQAGLNTDYIDYFGPKLLEQFAQVIAKEAIAVIRAKYVNNGTTEAVIAVEEHFGVEE